VPARYRKMKPAVTLSDEERQRLEQIRTSRSGSVRHVTRATILLLCADGHSKISVAEHQLTTYTVMAHRCIMDAWNSGGDSGLWKSFTPHMN